MKKIMPFILLFLIFGNSFSQIFKKHEENKLKFYGTLDFRNMTIESNAFESFGLKLGVGNKSLRFGVAYHIFHKNLFSILSADNFFDAPTVSHHQTKYHIGSLFTEIIAHQTPRWELLIPIHFGIGKMDLDADKAIVTHLHIRDHGLDYIKKTEWVESAVISVKANYRIVKWAGLTSGFGYKFAFSNDTFIRSAFSNAFYSFGIKLFFEEFGKLAKDKAYRKKHLFKIDYIHD